MQILAFAEEKKVQKQKSLTSSMTQLSLITGKRFDNIRITWKKNTRVEDLVKPIMKGQV